MASSPDAPTESPPMFVSEYSGSEVCTITINVMISYIHSINNTDLSSGYYWKVICQHNLPRSRRSHDQHNLRHHTFVPIKEMCGHRYTGCFKPSLGMPMSVTPWSQTTLFGHVSILTSGAPIMWLFAEARDGSTMSDTLTRLNGCIITLNFLPSILILP